MTIYLGQSDICAYPLECRMAMGIEVKPSRAVGLILTRGDVPLFCFLQNLV